MSCTRCGRDERTTWDGRSSLCDRCFYARHFAAGDQFAAPRSLAHEVVGAWRRGKYIGWREGLLMGLVIGAGVVLVFGGAL